MATPKLYLARPFRGQVIPPLKLVATRRAPEHENLEAAGVFFDQQARAIVEALHASLPGGTWDRVVGHAVLAHASHFVVNR